MSGASYGWKTGDAPLSVGVLEQGVRREIDRIRPRRVLDIGSGNGAFTALLARWGYEVVGIEYDPQGCAIAAENHPEIPFHCLGVEADPDAVIEAAGGRFDMVIATEVVEHLYAPHLLPRLARGVLEPGGHLLMTTPYHGYLKNLAISLTGGWDKHFGVSWHGGHIKFFSFATLRRLFEENGFTVVDQRGAGRMPYLWMSMVMLGRLEPDR